MPLWQAILLGVVQGLTEFLPISSTAHLLVARTLLGHAHPEDAFTVVIQLGTLVAVFAYFRADVSAAPRRSRGRHPRSTNRINARFATRLDDRPRHRAGGGRWFPVQEALEGNLLQSAFDRGGVDRLRALDARGRVVGASPRRRGCARAKRRRSAGSMHSGWGCGRPARSCRADRDRARPSPAAYSRA